MPAFVSEVFTSAENVFSKKAQVPTHKRGSLQTFSGKTFLNCCRYDENPHTQSTEDLDVADDDSDDDPWFHDWEFSDAIKTLTDHGEDSF